MDKKLDYFRVAGRVPIEVNDKLDIWYRKLGITKSALITLCIHAGLNSVIRAVSPEESISTEKLAELMKAYGDSIEVESQVTQIEP